ncbi:MAG: topoisomerase DNA-binding C4 zinc finger domain-containing protein [Kurthia sp.]|nr:topoisomerase DNA-binding C4 zinc finger domain-containing protein [Candidatus Kurthia equi]
MKRSFCGIILFKWNLKVFLKWGQFTEKEQAVVEICPVCRKEMVIKRERYTTFYGCLDYPTCRSTKKLTPSKEEID